MTLVPREYYLPARSEQEKIQTITGLLLDGFDRATDSPLTWGLDEVAQPEFTNDLHTNLSPEYSAATIALMGSPFATSAIDAWTFVNGLVSGNPDDWNVTGGEITDLRRSRLYMTFDLTEWIEFRNRDAAHLSFDDNRDRSPLGFTTVWLRAEAIIYHSRSKTARVYLQGQVANRIQSELIDIDPGSVRDAIQRVLDVDSGRVYNSVGGPC